MSKTAHVTEEVVVSKGVEEHVETIRDTVRRTEVEVNDDRISARAANVSGAGTGSVTTPGKPLDPTPSR